MERVETPTVVRLPEIDIPDRKPFFGEREGGWVLFDGEATTEGEYATLTPSDDRAVSVVMLARDVRRAGKAVFVRVHARAMSIDIPPTSRKNYPVNAAESEECRGSGTRCVGRVRYCCDTLENCGECPRNWRCPE